MANWVRLWDDMPDDPKWRLIARKAGASEAEVIAVFVRMMTFAGRADDRGSISGWDDEVESAALGIDEALVTKIREHMEGKVIENDRLRGWEKRQPGREDGSAERARQWRERKKNEANARERTRTHQNAEKRPDTDTDTEAEKKEDSSLRSLSCPVASDTDDPMTGATERETVEQAPAPKPRTPRSPAAPTEHPDFAAFWSAYPRRLGTNSRAGAVERFGALAKSGVDPGALIAGARRYADQCAARGVIGTEFVQQATTWLSPKNRAWEEAYELPDQPQQPQRRDGARQQAATGNPLLAACRDRLSRLGDGGRPSDPAPGASGRDALGDQPPHRLDRGEPVRGDYRGGDRRRGGDAFDDAASWR